ncbi:uncharacterized protein [Rutidosis leptorrhynchoides]|uniref:uncharacterized protein n=1 Tax=Rutidosis leptorrhynchoides TaxID=125765 RepID=UPI003A9A024F
MDTQSTLFNFAKDLNRLQLKSTALAHPPQPSSTETTLQQENAKLTAQLAVAVTAHKQAEERINVMMFKRQQEEDQHMAEKVFMESEIAALSAKLKEAEGHVVFLNESFNDWISAQESWGAKHGVIKAQYDILRQGIPTIVQHALDCKAVEQRFGAAMVAARAYERTLFWNVICREMCIPPVTPPQYC